MAKETDNSLYPIAVLIDELRNDDVNVSGLPLTSVSSLSSKDTGNGVFLLKFDVLSCSS